MKCTLTLLAALLLAGCGGNTALEVPPATPGVPPGMPTASPFAPETLTPVPSLTPIPSETPTPTFTPSPTPVPYTYVFPIRPDLWVGYTQGGHGFPAIDIFAQEGFEYLAATSGVVELVQAEDLWDPENDDPALRGGIFIAFIGDDGWRYYGSHLLAVVGGIRPGVRVEAGQLLGYVGMTGNAAGTLPHVHFGISHPTFPEDWETRRGEIDPFPYLEAWRAGRNLTPAWPTATPVPGQIGP
ncbi:MAG: M23 family metallopeptidase [Anaerolineales bacterium]|nr:M23 family metallopeptidase [Anaerolineales bacterium]